MSNNKMTRRELLTKGSAVVAASAFPMSSFGAAYPAKPITVAMLAPAGGATDRGVRPTLELMKKALGARAVAIQDMSGAGGVQAMDFVLGRPADGYTWAGMNDTIESFAMYGRVKHTWRDFDFWVNAGTPCGFVVRADSKIQTFDQMMDEIKANPGKYSVSSTPSGSLWSNVAVYARDKLGLDIKIVNYKGGGPSVRALLSGEVDIGCMGVTPQVSHIKVGKLRPLAATVPEDWETGGFVYPTITRWVDDPLMAKTLPWTNMNGIALKKGTPEDILKKIDAAFSEAMANPKMQEVYKSNGFFAYQKGRDQGANDLMKSRTEFQAFVVEVILNKAKVTRESLGIEKLEDKL